MSKYSYINNILTGIDQARFQRVCNHFLQSEYVGDLHTPGTVDGKDKTRKGKPDTYIIQPNGSYVIAEVTTKDDRDTKGFQKKLRDDLLDCLNFQSLDITDSQVNEIVLCCNSSTLELNYVDELRKLTQTYNIPLRVVGLESLVIYLSGRGKVFAKDYLNIPFNSGQVLTKSEFLEQYGVKNLSTPLNNPLIGRDKEIETLLEEVEAHSIIVVKGAPGVGKSKLCMEVIDRYLENNNNYIAYYIFPKSQSINEDLISFLEPGNSYLLFIDDANRQTQNLLSSVNQLIESGSNIKIIVTVRDYAKEDVLKIVRQLDHTVLEIQNLPDDNLRTILFNEPFTLETRELIDRIVNISEGNPRLAIMAANSVKGNSNLELLNDVTSIYEAYFQTIIDDTEVFKDSLILKVIGIVSFFYTIDLEDDIDKTIIKSFQISFPDFVEAAHYLEELEIIELFENTIKISEQVLSTYFFYVVFIKHRLLDLSILFYNYFKSHYRRIKDIFLPALSAFGVQRVLTPYRNLILDYYLSIQNSKTEGVQFFEVFGRYYLSNMFTFLDKQIAILPTSSAYVDFKIGSSNNSLSINDLLFRLFEKVYDSQNKQELILALELSVKYILKAPELFSALVSKLKEAFFPSLNDSKHGFVRQETIYQFFEERVNKNYIFKVLYYYVNSGILLSNNYINTFYSEINGIWSLESNIVIKRLQFLRYIDDNFKEDYELCYDLLVHYLDRRQQSNDVLLAIDEPKLIVIFENHFKEKHFDGCYLVHEFCKKIYNQTNFPSNKMLDLREDFNNKEFRLFQFLVYDRNNFRRRREKPSDWQRIDQLKTRFIRRKVKIRTLNDFEDFFEQVAIIDSFKYSNRFMLYPGVATVIDNTFQVNFELGFDCLCYYLSKGNILKYYPGRLFSIVFKEYPEHSRRFLSLLMQFNYHSKQAWLGRYFDIIPAHLIDNQIFQELIDFFKNLNGSIEIYHEQYSQYLIVEPRTVTILLEILIEKSKQNNDFKYTLVADFFSKNPHLIETSLELCKTAYLQQEKFDVQYDHDATELFALLAYDRRFIYDFVDYSFNNYRDSYRSSHKSFNRIWEFENAEEIVSNCLLQITKYESTGYFDRLGNRFFFQLSEIDQERADKMLLKLITDYSSDRSMLNTIFDIYRNVLKDYYYPAIQYFMVLNNDVELFKNVQWINNHFSSSGNQIWADFKAIEYTKIHDVLKQLNDPYKYIYHIEYLEYRIDAEKRSADWERKLYFRRYL